MFHQSYKEFKPAVPVSEFVECFWQVRGIAPSGMSAKPILPNGCIDIIFNLADLPNQIENDFPQLRSFVVGQMRKPVTVWQGNKVDLIGVRFRLGGAGSFLRVNAADINNSVLALDSVVGEGARNLEIQLAEQSFGQRVHLLEDFLRPKGDRKPKGLQTIEQATALIAQSHGTATVDKLCSQLEITARQIERLFIQHVGLSPKLACRIVRFRNAIKLLESSHRVTWADFALMCGYYDQAHFIRDFREFAGLTPSEYCAQMQNVAFIQSLKAENL